MIRRILKRLRSSPSPQPSPSSRSSPTPRTVRPPSPPVAQARPEPVVTPSPTEPRRLVLYKDDYCGFCRRVYRVVERLKIQLDMADTRTDAEAKKVHLERTGRRTVPCLYIDDIPLFESADIIEWLEAYAEAGLTGDG